MNDTKFHPFTYGEAIELMDELLTALKSHPSSEEIIYLIAKAEYFRGGMEEHRKALMRE